MAKLKLTLKYWVMFLLVLLTIASLAIWKGSELIQKIGIEIFGASLFVLLLSVAFRKIFK